MFNPVIILAILIQSIIAKFAKVAGAVFGYAITTGILVWGLSLYADGDEIAFFGIPFSQGLFLFAILVWYGFDTKEFLKVKKEAEAIKKVLADPLVRDTKVVNFYQTTLDAWSAGKLSGINSNFKKKGKMDRGKFIKKYPPIEGSALRMFFERFGPLDGEFLVGVGDHSSGDERAWFVLTNLRLIQKDGTSNEFKSVTLADVDTFNISGIGTKKLDIKMKSGGEVNFEKMLVFPDEGYLTKLIESKVQK